MPLILQYCPVLEHIGTWVWECNWKRRMEHSSGKTKQRVTLCTGLLSHALGNAYETIYYDYKCSNQFGVGALTLGNMGSNS